MANCTSYSYIDTKKEKMDSQVVSTVIYYIDMERIVEGKVLLLHKICKNLHIVFDKIAVIYSKLDLTQWVEWEEEKFLSRRMDIHKFEEQGMSSHG